MLAPCDEQPVNIERSNHKAGVALNDPINVDERYDKARPAAVCILENSQKVLVYADCWRLQSMEYSESRPVGHLKRLDQLEYLGQ